MKIIIWLFSAFLFALLDALFLYSGISLGGIPTIFLAVVCIFSARFLCKTWDKRKAPKSQSPAPIKLVELDPASPVDNPYPMWESDCKDIETPKRSTGISPIYCVVIALMAILLVSAYLQTRSLEDKVEEQAAYIEQLQAEYADTEQSLKSEIKSIKDKNTELRMQLIESEIEQVSIDSGAFAEGYVAGYYRAERGNLFSLTEDDIQEISMPSDFLDSSNFSTSMQGYRILRRLAQLREKSLQSD